MLAHLSVRESLQATSKAHSIATNSRRRVVSSIARAYYVASVWPSVELQAQLLRARRRAAGRSAFSEFGEQRTCHEDEDEPAQISLNIGPFSTLSIEPNGRNCRRIVVAIGIDTPIETIWSVLTNYEGLADFLPGLAVCKVEDRWENGARIFQIGEQNLALGFTFKAKGMIIVKEHPIEVLSSSICRRIDFEMIEGDFQIFKGTWQMEQVSNDNIKSGNSEAVASSSGRTILTYVVDVQPKIWLPVSLVEGILSKEIQNNLLCIRNQALKVHSLLRPCSTSM